MSQVVQRVVTWDEYVRGEPANLEHYEIEDGVVIELPASSLHHQRVVRRLLRVLEDFLASHRLGEVVAVPFDVVVQREPLRTRQPDLLVVLKGKVPQMEASPERLEIAPDLVVEVVSPHDSLKALMGKLNDYHRRGFVKFGSSTRWRKRLRFWSGKKMSGDWSAFLKRIRRSSQKFCPNWICPLSKFLRGHEE